MIDEIDLGQVHRVHDPKGQIRKWPRRLQIRKALGKRIWKQGTIFSIFCLHIYTKQGIQRKKIDELVCLLLCFPKKQKIRELRYPLGPLISPFRTHGGPVDTPVWTDNWILQFDSSLLVVMSSLVVKSFHGLQEPGEVGNIP